MTIERFDLLDEVGIRGRVGRIDKQARKASVAQVALDYIDGKMRGDVDSELRRRFPGSQSGDDGQQIFPIAIPLTERYVADAANAYNKPVERSFTDESGAESDATRAQTDALKRMLDEARYDDAMHRNEQIVAALDSGAVWYQVKRGKLYPQLISPHLIYPIESSDPTFSDHNDPDDYAGFVVEMFGGRAKSEAGKQIRNFAYASNAQFAFYSGSAPDQVSSMYSVHDNPYTWPQVLENPPGQDLPLRMLTFWHKKMPINGLLPDTESSIVYLNREINVALSCLVDNIRFQGHAVPVKKVTNPADPKHQQRHGVRFPVVLGIEETFDYVTSISNYTEQVQVLKDLVALLAVSKRMSPNEFALTGPTPASGFAKLIDALPKLDARAEAIRWLTSIETQVAFPRLISIGLMLGKLSPEVLKMKPKVKFPTVEFPVSEAETTAKLDRELKYNLTTPAKILAARDGITVEQAQIIIDENAAANATSVKQPQQEQEQGGGMSGMLMRAKFGERIRQPARMTA